ncbi:sensor histidine kinase [Endozoicomonas arenosclerae]|uniref:sensor histidine kinase n=1 Tax=Endozoicomonas arenosclerae TaxID=1633495 RepID=UPI000785C7E6|nr:ATP-binding protein [Endozoicomonas arenosclerae]
MLNTLNRKLSLALLIIVSGVGLAALVIGQWGMRLYYEELTQKLNQSIAMYVTSEHELIEDDVGSERAIRMLAHQAMIINPAVEVYLLDPQGKVLTHTLEEGELVRDRIDLEPVKRFLSGDERYPIRANDPRHSNIDKIFSASEIRDAHGLRGYFYVVLGGRLYDNISDRIAWSHISKQMFWSLLIIVASSALVGLLIFRLLSRPLTELSCDMSEFAQTELGSENLFSQAEGQKTDEVGRLSAVFQAMSERIKAQLEQLRATDRLRRELVSNVSHDLRTPLATMQGYVETLIIKDEHLAANQRLEYLRLAEKGCHRLSRLISDLFELSKLESGSKQPDFEHFLLAELMYDTVQSFRLTLKERGISLSIECNESQTQVFADIGMIQRVFDNLLKNAITHTPEDGSILIRLNPSAKGVNVTVEDTGRGIDENDLPRIFNRFYQASLTAEHRSKPGGIGLGLAIVKRILELHGSHIEVTSRLKKGTCFRFTLPV